MKTSRCMLCWLFTQNQADYLITFGSADKKLVVCRYCLEDLILLGFKANQIIRLRKPHKRGVLVKNDVVA